MLRFQGKEIVWEKKVVKKVLKNKSYHRLVSWDSLIHTRLNPPIFTWHVVLVGNKTIYPKCCYYKRHTNENCCQLVEATLVHFAVCDQQVKKFNTTWVYVILLPDFSFSMSLLVVSGSGGRLTHFVWANGHKLNQISEFIGVISSLPAQCQFEHDSKWRGRPISARPTTTQTSYESRGTTIQNNSFASVVDIWLWDWI